MENIIERGVFMQTITLPTFTTEGILPAGVYNCNLAVIKSDFTTIPDSSIRTDLFIKLEKLVADIKSTSLVIRGILIDGSFVTNKSNPSDIDIAIIFCDSVIAMDLPQFELRFINRDFIKEYYGFTMFPIFGEDINFREMINFYQQQEPPNDQIKKGILRIAI